MAPSYHDDAAWADTQPLPQHDTPHALAAIAYTDEYREAMGYLRAVMARSEYSERVLRLTEHLIQMNAAHYTVWLYRAQTLFALQKPLRDELAWLNPTALAHAKNYQIWHHRQTIVDALGSPHGEAGFIATMLAEDAKNYHVWSYRQWLVRRFGLFADEAELAWTEGMIADDVRNNSAWNHRWFVVVGGLSQADKPLADRVVEREISFAQRSIRKAPQNQSSWNYLRGILRHAKLPLRAAKPFALEFAHLAHADHVQSSHALDLLADVYAEESREEGGEEARNALVLLAERYDPIRARYWNYRKTLLDDGTAGAGAGAGATAAAAV